MILPILIPFDAYERNRKVASFLKAGEKVLDVGGGITGIKLFTKNPVKTLDIVESDIKVDPGEIPFAEGSWDVVTCVDVLEHIAPKDRRRFVDDLYKVASKRIIIAAPNGSKFHEEAEKRLSAEIRKKGKSVVFLEEHIKNGLPTPKEANPKGGGNVFYSGDFRFSNFLFRFQLYESGNVIVDKILLILKGIVNLLANLFLYPFWFYKRPSQYSNRFYVVIDKP